MQSGDTLQGIAQNLWGDASLWYRIADANGLTADSALVAGKSLSIPLKGPSNSNNAGMFRPYDASSAVGDLSPTLAKPPKKGKCGVFGQVLLAVIQIAVTVALTAVLAPVLGPFAPAVAQVGGDIVKQGIGVITGIQPQFSWNEVGMTAISAAIAPTPTGGFVTDVAEGAAANALAQGIGVATGLQKKFDWAGVAAAGVSFGVMNAVSNALVGPIGPNGQRLSATGKQQNWYQAKLSETIWNTTNGIGNIVARTAASAIADAATRSVINGKDFGDNLIAGLPDVISQTVGGLEQNALNGERIFFGDKGLPAAAQPGTGDGVADQPTIGEDGGKVGQTMSPNLPAREDEVLDEADAYAQNAASSTARPDPVPTNDVEKGPPKLTALMEQNLSSRGYDYIEKDGIVYVWEKDVLGGYDKNGNPWYQRSALKTNDDKTGSILVPQDYGRLARSLSYLRQYGEANYVIGMVFDKHVPVITWSINNDQFRASENAIYWNPRAALVTARFWPGAPTTARSTNHAMMSPALALLHEFGHAYDYNYSKGQFINDHMHHRPGYTDMEEFRVISGLELRAATFLGEPTRTNHGAYTFFEVRDPTRHVNAPVVN